MASQIAFVLVLLFVGCSVFSAANAQDAIAIITPYEGKTVTGTITFTVHDNGTEVTVNLRNVFTDEEEGQPQVGIHVHQYANVVSNTAGTGSHYDPDGAAHGCPENDPEFENIESGDLGNFDVLDGVIEQSKFLHSKTQLDGANSIIGRAVVIHDLPDPCGAGDLGVRIGRGVVGIASGSEVESGHLGYPLRLFAHLVGGTNCESCEGFVTAEQLDDSEPVVIYGQFTGLTGEAHGFHIHAYGDLSVGALTSAGGHYNPGAATHGFPTDEVHHEGDLGNIQTIEGGVYYYNRSLPFEGIDPRKWLGRAFMVHATNDHGAGEACDQAGSAGARLMAGVIGFNFPRGDDVEPNANYYNVGALLAGVTVNNDLVTESCVVSPPPPSDSPSDDPSDGPSDTPPDSPSSPNNSDEGAAAWVAPSVLALVGSLAVLLF